VAGEAGVPFFSISGSEFVEMFVGVGASVTGDTPVLVKTATGVALKPIAEVVDAYYQDGEANRVKPVHDLHTLGFTHKETPFRGASGEKKFFGGSTWSRVAGVYRHPVEKVYRIRYRGGELRTTGDHSVFVRERNIVRAKRADELKPGEVLVNLPFKVRGAFLPSIGTTHAVRAHDFHETEPLVLDVYGEEARTLQHQYEYARNTIGVLSARSVAESIGVSQATVLNWRNDTHLPRLFSSPTVARTQSTVTVTEELMRLLGYYAAEGDATEYGIRLTFGIHETDLHDDAVSLFKFVFNQDARREPHPETNSLRILISSKPLANFFKRHCGTGSHRKRLPAFLWTLPKRYFLAYLYGLARGDGYTTEDGKLSITSVSYEHIRELAWLSAMHGIPSGIRTSTAPAGRVIGAGKPLPETTSWTLIIGKTAHPFLPYVGTDRQLKKPVIESITEEAYSGYVYDLVGCDNEAFFGGEKPILLHNSRVRDLFQMAKRAAPAIIFVDEIDAVGRIRGTGIGGGNDEREQTLNQILVEMDGFEPNEKVIVMAASNRPDVLDPALLRPGRFDRRVMIDLPDRADREEILKIHARKKPLAEDVNLATIAERTPGFSGADLYSLMNEGAILAARENRRQVSQFDLIRSIEKVILGPERKSHVLNRREKEITAYHEAGHAIVSSILPYADPVHKISIISRGRAAGYTLKLPFEDKRMHSKREFLDDIASTLGGYVAEEMVFGDLTTGPSNDLQVLTALARNMVGRWGMSEKLGPIAFEPDGGQVSRLQGAPEPREYSDKVAAEIDAEVKKIIDDGYRRAREVLHRHRKLLDTIAAALIDKETLEREEFNVLLVAHGIVPKEKQDIEHQV
jgi:ATP-dependent metalloprotease FtsH